MEMKFSFKPGFSSSSKGFIPLKKPQLSGFLFSCCFQHSCQVGFICNFMSLRTGLG